MYAGGAALRRGPLPMPKGKNFEMLFSIAGAGPASLKVNGTEWLWHEMCIRDRVRSE